MSEVKKCCAGVYDSLSRRSYPCGKKAKVEREGKHYCGTHDPVARRAKAEVREAKWRKEFDEQQRVYRIQDAAHDLLEALQAAHAELLEMKAQIGFRANTLEVISKTSAAIAKATGADK